jgi:hypothetical protein
LLEVRKELEGELIEKETNLEKLERHTEELQQEREKIISILSSREFEDYLCRIDRLDEFRGILQILNEVLGNWKYLIDRERARDQFLSLGAHFVTSALDDAINETFLERCENYFRLVDENEFEIETITTFDYLNRSFTCNDHRQSIASLSGGTASVMTVLSLASKTTNAEFGTILLVDEFHDVAETLRHETYKRLLQNKSLSFSFFARPLDKSPLITQTVSIGA